MCMTFLNLLERKLFTHDSPSSSWTTEFEPDPICIPVAEHGGPVDNRFSNHGSAEHARITVWNGMLTEDVLQCVKPGTGRKDAPRAFSLKLAKVTRHVEIGLQLLSSDLECKVNVLAN